jgi:hypothetical protein
MNDGKIKYTREADGVGMIEIAQTGGRQCRRVPRQVSEPWRPSAAMPGAFSLEAPMYDSKIVYHRTR